MSTSSVGANNEPLDTGLHREENLGILAEKFGKLDKGLESNPFEKNVGVLDNILGKLTEMFKTTPVVVEKSKLAINTSNKSFASESLPNLESRVHRPEFGSCERPGKIKVFSGASCYSNVTVKFYVMDSRKFWKYALAFGVDHETSHRLALILVDSSVRSTLFRSFSNRHFHGPPSGAEEDRKLGLGGCSYSNGRVRRLSKQ